MRTHGLLFSLLLLASAAQGADSTADTPPIPPVAPVPADEDASAYSPTPVGAGLPRDSAPVPRVSRHEAAPTAEDTALTPGPVLVKGENDESWRELFAALAAQGGVFSTFTENRWFSVRRQPVVLRGELRHSPELGLCLRYTEPNDQQMIIDERGIVLRNAAGRSRTLKTDPRAPQVDAMLLHILRFDEAALREMFEIRAARDGERWRLDLEPLSPDLARAVGQITVEGAGEAVRRLEFRRGPKQRVEVLIGETRTGVVFTPEEAARFFR